MAAVQGHEKKAWYKIMQFELTKEQEKQVKKFAKKQDKIWMAKNEKNSEFGHPYYGAIGGSLSYTFTPTSIGTLISVKHTTGAVLDFNDGF